jgi:hypothetical protein
MTPWGWPSWPATLPASSVWDVEDAASVVEGADVDVGPDDAVVAGVNELAGDAQLAAGGLDGAGDDEVGAARILLCGFTRWNR